MSLQLPKIGFEDFEHEHDEEENFLTDSVRTHYHKYLIKLLKSFIFNDLMENQEDDIQKIAEHFELKAVRSCMVMDLYRKSILKTVSDDKKIIVKKFNYLFIYFPIDYRHQK